jgi:hypothetical protein
MLDNELKSSVLLLLEKLTVAHLVKKFPSVYGTRKFITVFTTTRHWSLSWARCIQSTPSNPVSLRSILILFYHLRLRLPSGLFPSSFPTKILYIFNTWLAVNRRAQFCLDFDLIVTVIFISMARTNLIPFLLFWTTVSVRTDYHRVDCDVVLVDVKWKWPRYRDFLQIKIMESVTKRSRNISMIMDYFMLFCLFVC